MQVHANAPWTPLRRRQLDAGQLSVPEADGKVTEACAGLFDQYASGEFWSD
jgi:hypothetical protein